GVHEMPRLDAFDEEFGREPVAILRGQRRKGRLRLSILLVLLLAAGAASAVAFAWSNGERWMHFEVPSAPSMPQRASGEPSRESGDGADDQVTRLRREVEALKKENSELAEAHQRAVETIASLKAGPEGHDPAASAYWYSDLGALNYGVATPPRPA